jgi:hypothetical protein
MQKGRTGRISSWVYRRMTISDRLMWGAYICTPLERALPLRWRVAAIAYRLIRFITLRIERKRVSILKTALNLK